MDRSGDYGYAGPQISLARRAQAESERRPREPRVQ